MLLPRIYDNLDLYLKPNKVLALFGPRQVGKTTLLHNFLKHTKSTYRIDSGDDIRIQDVLGSQDIDRIIEYAQGYDLIVLDEAQKIKNIGQGLKILVDYCKGIKVIATGSSSFDLAGQIGEPLTGRKITLMLFPLAQIELNIQKNLFDLKSKLPEFLIFGSYPEVITSKQKKEKISILSEITGSYLFKDILELERIKSSRTLLDLLRLLAFQIGSEVSLNELAGHLKINSKTVARYLDLLEKTFVIYRLYGYSRNLRSEITKKNKYYFFDNGIRNALIANFNDLKLRNDIGMLWENFLVMERLKKQRYREIPANNYFWRTWEQDEIDFIEEREGKVYGYEFKWKDKKSKGIKRFSATYPDAIIKIITKNNYLPFIL